MKQLKIWRGLYCIKKHEINSGLALTIGNFDGLHLAHQTLLARLLRDAEKLNLQPAVMAFRPSPAQYFFGTYSATTASFSKISQELTTWKEKVMLFAEFNMQQLIFLRFNKYLATMSAEDFVKKTLVEKLNVRYLLVGDDFRFGAGRTGDVTLLTKMAQQLGFVLNVQEPFLLNEQRVSSTVIREALTHGKLAKAAQLLGRNYFITGRVVAGEGIATPKLQLPTANLKIKLNKLIPPPGVYLVRAFLTKTAQEFYGICNIGFRPTNNTKQSIVETHLFDFKGNIYADMLRISFLEKLRDEYKFASLDLLREQIARDLDLAQNLLLKIKGSQ